ncbi:MAG: hypothetical protein GXP45_06695 [bacterium]|nr:hypothetical protein [bacterium]
MVETDDKMVHILQNLEDNNSSNSQKLLKKEQILHQSIMDFSIPDFFKEQKLDKKKTLIVGNLPYYITSPILRMFFGNGQQSFSAGIFMVQEEVGQKIKHNAQKKSFLRRLVNYAYEVYYLKTVAADSFSPAPKVKSCLVSFSPKKKTNIPNIDFDELYHLLDQISGFKRKTLGRIQKLLSKKNVTITINPQLSAKRIEELSWKDMEIIFLENKANLHIVGREI